jgi:serine acetyltransferase
MRQNIQRVVSNGDYSRLIPIGLISNGYRPKLAQVPVNRSYMTILLNYNALHALKLKKLMHNQIKKLFKQIN